MNRSAALILVALAATGMVGCKEKKAKEALTRSKGGAAVVLVEGPKGVVVAEEASPADGEGPAQELALGSAVQGTMASAQDVDRYAFTTAEGGLLEAQLTPVADADLILELWDGGDKAIAIADRGPKATNEGIVGFPLTAGTSYQLVVREFQNKRRTKRKHARVGASQPYRLDIGLMEPGGEDAESEPNEELEAAGSIAPGEERSGFIGWNRDRDVWRLPVTSSADVAPETGELPEGETRKVMDIELSGVRGSALVLSLLDAEGTLLAKRSADRGEDLSLRFLRPEVGIEEYLIAVESKRSNPKDAYKLYVEEHEVGLDTEIELNDTLNPDNELRIDESGLGKLRGELTAGDVDIIAIPGPETDSLIDVKISGPAFANFVLTALDVEGVELSVVDEGASGASEELRHIPAKAHDATFLKIEGKSLKAPAAYEINVSVAPGILDEAPLPDGESQ